MNTTDSIRLQVYIAKCGFGSRRKCEEIIETKRVTVNGEIITTMGYKVFNHDKIAIDGKIIKPESKKYLVLNKPRGYLCSNSDKSNKPLAIDLLSESIKERLFHVGRLDFLSSGLIFYTNDGEFANIITHPSYEIDKEYLVESIEKIPEYALSQYLNGIEIEKIIYKLKKYRFINPHKVILTIIEGKNREIRKVLNHYNITVKIIHRIKIGCVSITGIKKGEFRHLSDQEIAWFLKKNR